MVGELPDDLAAAAALGGEMGRQFAEFDWASHPLGPVAQWPPEARAAVAVALTSRFPIVLWLDPDELFLIYNDGYVPMLGDKHPAALGRPGREVWWEVWELIGPMLAGVVTTGQATWSDDLMLALVSGGRPEERYFTFSYGPILSSTGAAGGVFCAVTETTERVLGERRLHILNTAAAALMETRTVDDAVRTVVRACGENHPDLPFIAVYVDVPGRPGVSHLCGASPAVGSLLPERLSRLAPVEAGPPRPLMRVLENLTTAVPGLPEAFAERCPERALLIGLGDGAPGSAGGYLVIGLNPRRPLDEQYRAFCRLLADQLAAAFATADSYEQQRRRADALTELDRAKTAFLTNVSHEFRTPLTLLLGPLDDALAEVDADPAQRARLETARRNAGRLLRLVNSLLEFSRVEAGRVVAKPVTVDLGALTAQIASTFAGLCERAGIALVLRCRPVLADVDVGMWETVVLNLLSNAVKFTRQGSITVEVDSPAADRVGVRVTDTGTGVADADLGHLFERFYRAGDTRGRSVEGSGIGLSLVHSLVELHHGSIGIASPAGTGTTVTIDLPAASGTRAAAVPAPSADNPYVTEAMQWVDDAVAPDPDGGPGEGLVLIADDNPDMRRHLRRILSARWRTIEYGDGATALLGVREHRPDVIVTDVMMPGLDGFGLVAAVRADPELAATPVLMLSARAGVEAAGDGLARGADDYLGKPFTSHELIDRVQARFSASARQRTNRRHDEAQARHESAVAQAKAALGSAESTEAVLAGLLASPGLAPRASVAGVALLDPLGHRLTAEYAGAIGAEFRDRYHVMDVAAPVPIAEAVRTGRPVVIPDAHQVDGGYQQVVRDGAPDIAAAIVHPLRDGTAAVIGALLLAWPTPRDFTPGDLAGVADLAGPIGTAMARIRAAEREHHIATSFQDRLLTLDRSSAAVVVGAQYQPATQAMRVGGDWYLVTPLTHGRVGVCVGDVVGHGLPAATAMGSLRAGVAATALTLEQPHRVLPAVQRYAETVPDARCSTLTYAVVDTTHATLEHISAGHPYPLVVHRDGTCRYLTDGRQPPLASVGLHGDRPPGHAGLPAGSLLILYTDGLVERPGESLYTGLDRLARCAARCADLPVQTVCATLVEDLAPPGGYTDDVVVLALRSTGSTDTTFAATVPAHVTRMAPLRQDLRDWLGRLDLGARLEFRIIVGVGEAVANAIEHGSGNDRDKTISVEVFARPDAICATVSDTGQWSSDSAASHREAYRGRGLTLINGLAEDVNTVRTPRGTHVTMRYPRSPGEAQ